MLEFLCCLAALLVSCRLAWLDWRVWMFCCCLINLFAGVLDGCCFCSFHVCCVVIAAGSLRFAACCLQLATCWLQRAAYNLQLSRLASKFAKVQTRFFKFHNIYNIWCTPNANKLSRRYSRIGCPPDFKSNPRLFKLASKSVKVKSNIASGFQMSISYGTGIARPRRPSTTFHTGFKIY